MNIYLYIYLCTYVCMNVCMKVDSEWIVPFMSAYVDVRTECQVEDAKFTMLFVSRRCKYRPGRPDIQSIYVCMYAFMYVCMYVWFLQCRLQIHEERLGRKRKRSEFCGIITMYVCIYTYAICISCMYVCMQWLIVCMLLCCRKRSSFSSIRTAK